MQEKEQPQERKNSDRNRLVFVLLMVLVICGGNGVSLLAGGLLWKFGFGIGAAIGAVVGITAVAFAAAMVMLVRHIKKLKDP